MEHLAHALPNDIASPGLLSSGLSFWTLPNGVWSSAIASLGQGLGAIPVLLTSQLSDRWKSLLLSIGGGVMLSSRRHRHGSGPRSGHCHWCGAAKLVRRSDGGDSLARSHP